MYYTKHSELEEIKEEDKQSIQIDVSLQQDQNDKSTDSDDDENANNIVPSSESSLNKTDYEDSKSNVTKMIEMNVAIGNFENDETFHSLLSTTGTTDDNVNIAENNNHEITGKSCEATDEKKKRQSLIESITLPTVNNGTKKEEKLLEIKSTKKRNKIIEEIIK